MKKEDARTLLPETQEHIRRQAIRLKKKGKKYVAIAEIVGVHRNTVSNWWKTYEREGAKGLKAKKRGFEPGQWRTLDAAQEDPRSVEVGLCPLDPPGGARAHEDSLWSHHANSDSR